MKSPSIVQITNTNVIQMNGKTRTKTRTRTRTPKATKPVFRDTPPPCIPFDISNQLVTTADELRPLLFTKKPTIRMVWGTLPVLELLLRTNTRNRKLRPAAIAALKESLGLEGWMFNGATVVMGWDAVLLDGQHRITLIRESGEPKMFLLVLGVDPAAAGLIDSHRRRSVGDKLSILDNHINTDSLAAACKLVYYFERDRDPAATDGKSESFTYFQAKDVIKHHPDIVDCVNHIARNRGVGMPNGLLAAYLYLMRKVDKEKADDFMTKLGKELSSDLLDKCPIRALWQFRNEARYQKFRLQARVWAFLLRDAWKSFYLNQPYARIERNKVPAPSSVEATTFGVEGLPADWNSKK